MFKSLYGKLVALMLAILVVVGCVQIVLMSYSAQRYFQEVTQDVNRDVARQVASRREILADHSFDRDALKRLFSELMTTHPSIEVYALQPDGKIFSFSAPPDAVVRTSVSLSPIRRFLAGDRLPVLGDDPRAPQGQKVFSVAPVETSAEADTPLAGYIYVILEGQPYQSAVQRLHGSYILRQSVLVAAASLVFALLAALYLLRGLTLRLRRLTKEMHEFEHSGFSQPPIVVDRSGQNVDEIKRLEELFATMATRIVMQVKELRNVDAARREMLANLSHDLRTPLASLQGYLDTVLLKEEQLSRREQHEYLHIAARHGERLGKLVEDLFELAKLDSAHIELNRETLSMAELVQDSVQKFRLSAQERGVRLEVHLDEQLPAVSVDVSLMARAIDNLLENGLRHTARAGKVSAAVTAKNGKVAVCVADEGCGIAPEDLPRIFERFYQSSTAGASRQGGLGLGLAITRQIIERHGASLTVVSTIGVGTRFDFELDAAPEPARRDMTMITPGPRSFANIDLH